MMEQKQEIEEVGRGGNDTSQERQRFAEAYWEVYHHLSQHPIDKDSTWKEPGTAVSSTKKSNAEGTAAQGTGCTD